ncbi:MAG: hypothetical protein R3E32_08570 [Chitinophagales bacterium]
MWKTTTILLFGVIAIIILVSTFFYFNGQLTKYSLKEKEVENFYEIKFDSVLIAYKDSVIHLFSDSLNRFNKTLTKPYTDSINTYNTQISQLQRNIDLYTRIPKEIEIREKRRESKKMIERKLHLKSFEGIYEEPLTKVLFFGQVIYPNHSCTVKLTFPNERQFEETWLIGKVYYYHFDDTNFYMEVFVETITQDQINFILKIY